MAGFLFKLRWQTGRRLSPRRSPLRSQAGARVTRSRWADARYAWCGYGMTTPINRQCSSSRTWPDEPLALDLTFRRFKGAGRGKRPTRRV
jgi:hypothetical protein